MKDHKMALESNIQVGIMRMLRNIPMSEWTKPTITNKKGETDNIGHVQGHAIYIEFKRGKECKPNALQQYRIDKHIRFGATAFWTYSVSHCREQLRALLALKGIVLDL